jgi:PHD/YefM family antitoxin component YafN of YafNO toxin-antitoxin module
MTTVEMNITQARDELTSLPEQLAVEPGTIAVMRRGKPVLAVMPWDLYESIVETLEVMSDPELTADLRQAIDWERAKREL